MVGKVGHKLVIFQQCHCLRKNHLLVQNVILNIKHVTKCSINVGSILFRFIEKLQQDIPGKGVRQQLEALCSIYSLFLLHKHQGDFLVIDYITPKQASLANDQLRALYTQVCPIYFCIMLFSWSPFLNFLHETRCAQMLLHSLMRSTTPTTSLAPFLVATMGMCIQNFTRRLGKIPWTTQSCPMAITNTSGRSSSNNCEAPGYDQSAIDFISSVTI